MGFAEKYSSILALVILTGFSSIVSAQQELHWVPTNGPYTPLASGVNFLEADGHIFGPGVQSSDDGLTWETFNCIPASQLINGQSLSVDSEGRLYWYFSSFFYYSSDSGIRWSNNLPTPSGMTGTYDTLIIDGRGRLLEQKYGGTLYWTLDFGTKWDSVRTSTYPYYGALNYDRQQGWYYEYVPDILDAGYGNNLFAWPDSTYGGYEAYFYHSEDLEQTWKKITVDSGRRGILDSIYWFNDSSIWVATDSGLFMSNDSGNSFAQTGTGIPRTQIYLFRWLNDSSIWIATDSGLFTSQDRAKTFAFSSGFSGNSVRSIALGATNAMVLAAYGNDSAFISHDGGNTWKPLPFQQVSYPTDAFFTSNKGTLFLSNNGTVLSSRDNGYTWLQDAKSYRTVGLLFPYKNTLWVGDSPIDDSVYFSPDHNAIWEKIATPTYIDFINFFEDGTLLGMGDDQSIWLSSDEGQTWKQSFTYTGPDAEFVTLWHDTVLIEVDSTIFITRDRFLTWDTVQIGAHDYGVYPTTVINFEMDSNGTLWITLCGYPLYASNKNPIYVSSDLGKTKLFSIEPYTGNIGGAVNYCGPNGISYIFDGSTGLLESKDNGKTWDTLPPLPATYSDEFIGLPFLQINSELLFPTGNTAIFTSMDSGRDWVPINNLGLENVSVEQIVNIDDTLFARTTGGIYRVVLPTVSGAKVNTNPIDPTGLLSIVPNPSTTEVTATVELSRPGFIELSLYDTKGVKLASVSEWQAESIGNYPFDLSKLPDGIYFLSLIQSDHAPVIQKIVKE